MAISANSELNNSPVSSEPFFMSECWSLFHAAFFLMGRD